MSATLTFLQDDWAVGWGIFIICAVGFTVWMVTHAFGWLRGLLNHE